MDDCENRPNGAHDLRCKIARALPFAVKTALDSYLRFIEEENNSEPKKFKEHHDACKAAITHIELLNKLSEHLEDKKSEDNERTHDDTLLADMIESAREVQRFETMLVENEWGKETP